MTFSPRNLGLAMEADAVCRRVAAGARLRRSWRSRQLSLNRFASTRLCSDKKRPGTAFV
jgi:hypothetical protein